MSESWIDRLIDRLPLDLTLPGFEFCGPGTKLKERLEEGRTGVNPLDSYCREHDISYANSKDPRVRAAADEWLQRKAEERLEAPDASWCEKIAALLVRLVMAAKRKMSRSPRKLGGGKKKGRGNRRARVLAPPPSPYTPLRAGSGVGWRRRKRTPKKGGHVLPLAAGVITGAASLHNSHRDSRAARQLLLEVKRHNAAVEKLVGVKKSGGGVRRACRRRKVAFL